MSSTNRGGRREPSDYYVTPLPTIRAFLKAWMRDVGLGTLTGLSILDPCAGGDAAHPMSYPTVLQEYGACPEDIFTVDIREDSRAMIHADYLGVEFPLAGFVPDIAVSNPPFSLAGEFIRKALRDVAPGGWVVFLLRLNVYGGWDRYSRLWPEVGLPKLAYAHPYRIGFRPEEPRKTDSIEYMHACWRQGERCESTVLRLANDYAELPPSERRKG